MTTLYSFRELQLGGVPGLKSQIWSLALEPCSGEDRQTQNLPKETITNLISPIPEPFIEP